MGDDNIRQLPVKKSRRAQPVERKKVVTESQNQKTVRAIVVGVTKQGGEVAGRSNDLGKDPFAGMYGANTSHQLIYPPYDLLTLAQLEEHSSELGPCVQAMETNIAGFGWKLKPIVPVTKSTDKAVKEAMRKEMIRVENFFRNCGYGRKSFTKVKRDTRHDLEDTGNAYWEIINNLKGDPAMVNQIPSHTVRLSTLDKEQVQVKEQVLEQKEDGTWDYVERTVWKRFRMYCQIREGNKAWFKEFGDPRVYDVKTGDMKDESWPAAQRANEMIHFKLYSSRSPYGLPRYIGNLFSIFGSRAAEEINYVTLKNNNIPSMVVMVANGQLTESSINRVQQFVEEQIQGESNYSRFLILEAEPASEMPELTGSGTMKMDIKPLKDQQMSDAMFQEYDKGNNDKVRRSFRLSPLFLGEIKDYNRATMQQSRRDTEEQVFAPERNEDDWVINATLMARLQAKYYKFKTNTPDVTDDASVTKVMSAAERSGGMTPRIARIMTEDIMGMQLGNIDEELGDKADTPFTILVAEAAKNVAPVNMGTTVGVGAQVAGQPVRKGADGKLVESLLFMRNAMDAELLLRTGQLGWQGLLSDYEADVDEPDEDEDEADNE